MFLAGRSQPGSDRVEECRHRAQNTAPVTSNGTDVGAIIIAMVIIVAIGFVPSESMSRLSETTRHTADDTRRLERKVSEIEHDGNKIVLF
jgi:hypothetical protein